MNVTHRKMMTIPAIPAMLSPSPPSPPPPAVGQTLSDLMRKTYIAIKI